MNWQVIAVLVIEALAFGYLIWKVVGVPWRARRRPDVPVRALVRRSRAVLGERASKGASGGVSEGVSGDPR